ncbi:tRNA1(Val) (adenine(37)-N6)-methyltransferase [Hymenobacter sp. BT491]|uniref:tRNA1(Val) (adenine(37)-N6)-methyltransferase n=1 Tax=Hymenobacter sp. BT491 TaxID=2766779 RepID=UPI00292A3C03|nr:methyltransferase [Hymenobacter sp. BT491]
MPNPYFKFKHFTVHQDSCAMKVCTDACVLGATADVETAAHILDIGTGTGLLALMAAQRAPTAYIEAVEVDADAAAQATENFQASPWASRLQLQAVSLQEYAARNPALFDHILCNPPFFRNSLRSPDAARTAARHTAPDTLPFSEIAAFAAQHLVAHGQLTVLLPPPEMQHFEREAAAAGLYAAHRLTLHHRASSRALRHITSFERQPQPLEQQALAIHTEASEAYSPAFRTLLQDFYLAF